MTLPVLGQCRACERLVEFREANAAAHPDWHNAPVGTYGDPHAQLLVVGLAPGLKGANRTGVPFCGDESGDWLWEALHREGFSAAEHARDSAPALKGVAITNAVKCVPPGNKPSAAETNRCREHLERELASLRELRVVVALGRVAHDALLRAYGIPAKERPFAHGRVHRLEERPILVDCFHPSPLNTRTGRMTKAQWRRTWAKAAKLVTEVWYVYIVKCSDGTLYTGVSTDPVRRRTEHATGKGARYTKMKGVEAIVHVEPAPSKSAALSREHEIKQWKREKKLALIAG